MPQLACDWIPAHLAVSRRNFSDCGFFWGPTMKPLHDLFAFSLVAISLLGSLPTHASPIVGGWYGTHLGQADSTAVITFLADGSYWMAEDGSSVLDPSGQDGMERGTYTWNPLTSAFSSTTLVDTSGQWGLSHSGLTSIGISGDTMTIDVGVTLNRVTSPTSAIVGSWYATPGGQAASTVLITFLSDGSYMMAEDGSSILDPSGQDGMEQGSFTWNALTNAFSSTTLVDTSGEWGLSHSNIASAAVSCNTLQLSDGGDTFTLVRVVSDPQVCAIPEPQTWANLLLGLGLMAAFVRRRSISREGAR
ncbi:MAG: hypothetical protein JNM54_08055 [Candidatus Accumulibacter sp.]|uniref:PEP-CTERM sorting domain-containing protein n=2 Tax=unclassified Candidatus Accumulibacter TaxID=2619054 RepID=UPI001A461D4A|nr:PEP-CTERM sorting domain-containing protein [Candidatus Accumulibacter sp. ACC005]MBL8367856.1 hypothetical protein [Accumulibacter sp.]MBN8514438.1 hypothetical protein [Accumulibacter sp.]